MSELDLLLDGSGGDGLVDGPLQGADQPGVAGEADLAGAGVDAFDQFVVEPDGDLLHADTVSELTSDIDSDIILGMTTKRVVKTYRGKGAGRMIVWAVREYQTIGTTEVYETVGVWATESEAKCAAECGQASCRQEVCEILR